MRFFKQKINSKTEIAITRPRKSYDVRDSIEIF